MIWWVRSWEREREREGEGVVEGGWSSEEEVGRVGRGGEVVVVVVVVEVEEVGRGVLVVVVRARVGHELVGGSKWWEMGWMKGERERRGLTV